jgi:hypothetical protein
MKSKLDRDERQDIAISITNKLIKLGYVPDCVDTDNEDEFVVQDLIAKVLKKHKLCKKYPKKLSDSDYVLYDVLNDKVKRFAASGDVIIYRSYIETLGDIVGTEVIYACTALPKHHQKRLIKQINKK